jgi:hypothetical protein
MTGDVDSTMIGVKTKTMTRLDIMVTKQNLMTSHGRRRFGLLRCSTFDVLLPRI